MKILRKGDDFKKMPESNLQELLLVKRLLNEGWQYCSKQSYKDFHEVGKKSKSEEDESSKSKKKVKKD